MKTQKIVIVGSGTGGTIVSNRIHKKLKKGKVPYEITVIDPTFQHLYQPGFLFTMVGKEKDGNLIQDSRKMMPKIVNSIMDKVKFINTEEKFVETVESGNFGYDYLIIASGSRLAFDSVDWWNDSIHHFYNQEGSTKLRGAIESFEGGKIVVSIADLPYKCPPAPIEAAMLLDDYFKKKGMRDKVEISYTSPLGRAFSIETTNTRVEPYLEEKNIALYTMFNTDEVDTEEKVIYSMEGEDLDYDLLIMVPPHNGHRFIIDSGIAEGQGWIDVDRHTLQVLNQDSIYALGDTTNLPISKAGSTAHHEAPVIAQNIYDEIMGKELSGHYNGEVQCFFLTSFGSSMFINFDYDNPPKPSPTRRIWYWFKLVFKPMYFRLVTRGRV
ncbi:MAG: NAD(P)/FAD-dependent oxidoreductase [Candidatus Heimdallarchaeota archaeon]|nr:NAD(P)/FAD-dependent oxidoreductase [Candidatus Heimdallarchaeota archaeon]